MINDPLLLKEIADNCYNRKDVSASWIGSDIPCTESDLIYKNGVTFKRLAIWARQHYFIYRSFIDEFCQFNRDILDVGAGAGHTTLYMARKYPNNHVIGIDSDKKTVDFACKYNSNNVNLLFLYKDLLKYKANHRFGYIFALDVLEHVKYSRQNKFIKKCLDLLTDQGRLFICTPNGLNDKAGGHHKGLLTKNKFPKFYRNHRDKIVSFSYLDNQKLATCVNSQDAVIRGDPSDFASQYKNRSHFRIVMSK